MYSLTQTGVHLLSPLDQNEPIVKMICKCNRNILQQEIYTCLACASYSCHYCTVPQFSSYQCRSCKKVSESTIKNSKCNFCYSCPYCNNVLTLTKDKSKYWIYFCQFCYWSTKEINFKDESSEGLQNLLFKISNLKENQNKIYTAVQSFFKQSNNAVQAENQSYKSTSHKRTSIRSSLQESNLKDKQQVKKINEGLESMVKRIGLEQEAQEFISNQHKYPQPLPLLTKKTRRCPECAKPVTNIYKPVVSNELSVELIHKQLKVIQCQRTPPIKNKVKVKFLKNCQRGQKTYKIGDIQTFPIESPFVLLAHIQNKKKNASVQYRFKIEVNQKKK